MTPVARQARRQVIFGLVAISMAISAVLAGESSAGAAINAGSAHSPRNAAHSAHSPRATVKRDMRHERVLRDAPDTRHARRPGARRTSAGPRKPAAPQAIAIPSAGIAARLMTIGGATGPAGLSLPVPPLAKAATDAGWYTFTAVPGAAGNAVIAGHVDTYVGPGVFYNLYQLRPGDPVYVDTGGIRQRFDVTSVRELPKDRFPVNQVFGATTRHMLWLITCGGAFDYQTRHYLSNIVVSAAWVGQTKN
jgi:LPXTG-site transpeptidase (sortase) family protein